VTDLVFMISLCAISFLFGGAVSVIVMHGDHEERHGPFLVGQECPQCKRSTVEISESYSCFCCGYHEVK
jgi:hypothetical protein